MSVARSLLLRSLLVFPGNSLKMIHKATSVLCDALIPDLEDAVPDLEAEKAKARTLLQGELQRIRAQAKAKC